MVFQEQALSPAQTGSEPGGHSRKRRSYSCSKHSGLRQLRWPEREADTSDLEFSSQSDYENSRTSDENKETKNNGLGRRIHTSSFKRTRRSQGTVGHCTGPTCHSFKPIHSPQFSWNGNQIWLLPGLKLSSGLN